MAEITYNANIDFNLVWYKGLHDKRVQNAVDALHDNGLISAFLHPIQRLVQSEVEPNQSKLASSLDQLIRLAYELLFHRPWRISSNPGKQLAPILEIPRADAQRLVLDTRAAGELGVEELGEEALAVELADGSAGHGEEGDACG